MQTIFLINDESQDADNAAAFAWYMARTTRAKIVLGSINLSVGKPKLSHAHALITTTGMIEESVPYQEGLLSHLKKLNAKDGTFTCSIEELDISRMDANSIAMFINQNDTLMIIKAANNGSYDLVNARPPLNICAVLSKVNIPICLVPATWQPGPLQSVAYLTDLRYCRTDIISHLLKCMTPNTAVYIAHMAMNGVVDLALEYANRLFKRLAGMFLKESKLYLHHIKERQSITVADVLANSMKNDALVLTNRSATYNELIGADLSFRYPDVIRIPLFIYPA
jgi:hypothetical protein